MGGRGVSAGHPSSAHSLPRILRYAAKRTVRIMPLGGSMLDETGMRISELCSLKINDVNLYDGTILIYGKGDKERRIQIGNESVMNILAEYNGTFGKERQTCNNFFVNQSGKALSDQSVRRMINKYTALASIDQHITPHMFRHTFATSLLEADVDIRYIQDLKSKNNKKPRITHHTQ